MTTALGDVAPGDGARSDGGQGTGQEVPAAGDTTLVEERLRTVGRGIRRAILAAVPDVEPHDNLYRLVRSYPTRPGKAIRPALQAK